MRRFDLAAMSVGAWKVLLCGVALFVLMVFGTELWYAPRILAPDSRGTLGIEYHQLHEWGRSRFVIDYIAPGSTLQAAGAVVGDIWIPDRHYDAYRWLERHETIGLTLVHAGQPRHLTVETMPDAKSVLVGPLIESWVVVPVGLVLGLFVGFRQPRGRAFRALALGLLLWAVGRAIPTYVMLPAGGVFVLQDLVWGPILMATGSAVLIFIFNFPDDRPSDTTMKRRLLRYGVPIFAAAILVFLAASTIRALGYYSPPSIKTAFAAAVLPFTGIALPILWSNWRSSSGELRERHLWVGLAWGLQVPAAITAALLLLLITDRDLLQVAPFAPRTLMLLGNVLFAYAALKHRVVSASFVANRAAVYGVASLGMVVSFALVEWFTHNLLAAWGHEQSPYIDAGIALAIILVFHRLRHNGEQWVERLFFHSWHVKEAALRQFIAEAPYITRTDALRNAFAAALEHFTGGAPQSFYRRLPSGDYERMAATSADAPERVDADDPLAVTLRATQAVTYARDTATALKAEIALPSVHHGELDGFVLLGPKSRREPYRPDELDVLGLATRHVGLDLRALRMEQLERENRELQRKTDELQARNDELGAREGALIQALQRNG
jgi:hypothetical protein